jgi:hypothetical protein
MSHTHPHPERMAGAMLAGIRLDTKAGVIPADVACFSDLHDYVDANEYALEACEALGWSSWTFECQECADTFNGAAGLVDEWLKGRASIANCPYPRRMTQGPIEHCAHDYSLYSHCPECKPL